jgi:hypothetical protein
MTAQIVFLPFRTEQAGNFKNYAKIIIFRVLVKKLNGQRKGSPTGRSWILWNRWPEGDTAPRHAGLLKQVYNIMLLNPEKVSFI